jgi:cyclin-dependent kinase 2
METSSKFFHSIDEVKTFLSADIKLNPLTKRKISNSGKIYKSIFEEIKNYYPSLLQNENNSTNNNQCNESNDNKSNYQPEEKWNYSTFKKIGKGSYGIVYNGQKGNFNYAIKRNLVDDTVDFIGSIRELDLMMRMRHPNITKIIELIYTDDQKNTPFRKEKLPKETKDDIIHFVFELALYDLHKLIYHFQRNDSFFKFVMADILLGLEYSHARGIIHRDLKPSNILIFRNKNKSFTAKICDFGLSKPFTYQGIQSPRVLTSCYRPPEVINRKKYDHKVDIWSVGCVFFEMFTRKRMIDTMSDRNDEIVISLEKSLKIKEGKPFYLSQLPEDSPEHLDSLLKNCLETNPEKRSSATQLLNHPFFDSVRKRIDSVRSKYPPLEPSDPIYKVSERIERQYMCDFYKENIKSFVNCSWYKPRRIFLAIDLFDRYLVNLDLNKKDILSKEETYFYNFMCIYISIKYYSCTDPMPAFKEITINRFISKEWFDKAFIFEQEILSIFSFKIYRKSIYEACDSQNIHLSSQDLSTLLSMILYESNVFQLKSMSQCAQLFTNKLKHND